MGIANSERLLKGHIPGLLSLWRGGGGSGPLTKGEVSRAGEALLRLQRGLTGERSLAGAGYMQDSTLLGAYLLYYWPVSYLQVSLALSSRSDLLSRLGDGSAVRVLDLGCGPGAASSAFCDLLPGRKKEVFLVDASQKAMKIANRLLAKDDVAVTENVMNFQQDALPKGPEPFDVIIVNHLLNELWTGMADAVQRRVAFLIEWTKLLKPSGLLFFAEPALLSTSRDAMAVRDGLASQGFSVLSPCTGDRPCPALLAGEGNTCHGEVGWNPIEPIASLARVANLDRESVKMTFFLMGKEREDRNASPQGVIRARVVSDAMLNKSGRVRYLLCDGSRRFAFSADKKDPFARKAGFDSLRRYDLVEITGAEARGDAYGCNPRTVIKLLSRIAR